MIRREDTGFTLVYGALELPFTLETRKRKTLAISMTPDRTLHVVAPLDADEEKVLARVDGRASWIAKQWRIFAQVSPQEGARYEYFSGETHWYLGRPYRLKIRPPQAGQREAVQLEGRFLWITTSEPTNTVRIERLLDSWYRTRARETFDSWLNKCLSNARSLGIQIAPPIEIRKMQKRWGSCTSTGKILLNLDLVKAPVDLIEYVIFHELCHIHFPHHGAEFYRLLSRFLPDWDERKSRLEQWGERI